MIHIWVQPYKKEFLNAWDGIILLTMVLVVNLNTFASSLPTAEISVILVLFPILLLFLIAVTKLVGVVLSMCKKRINHYKTFEMEDAGNMIDRDAILRYSYNSHKITIFIQLHSYLGVHMTKSIIRP